MRPPVAIIGAGPYALSTAAFLRRAGVETRIHGEVMGFWKTMPDRMLLRSYYRASNIADAPATLTLPAYEAEIGRSLERPIPLQDFIDYGHWFQQRAGLEVDARRITHLARNGGGFHLTLDDGDELEANHVVVAAGITAFAWRPPEYDGIDPSLVSHTSEHRSFERFRGRRVAVVGGGQSALESLALLHEADAVAELIVRRPGLRFLRGERLYDTAGPVSRLMYPAWGVGPPGINWVMGRPSWFRHLPSRLADPLARRAIRPAGGAWLRPRLEDVPVSLGRRITAVEVVGQELQLTVDDERPRRVDHLMFGTGYRVDLSRYSFLDRGLREQIRLIGTYPRLSSGFESSVPGLYFVGAPAAASAGPGMRFVSHTGFVARAITRDILADQ